MYRTPGDQTRGAPDRRSAEDAKKRPRAGRRLETRMGASKAPAGDARKAPASAILGEKLHHVVEPEATVASLADAIEGQLASIAQPLHRVHVKVEHLGDFGCREHRPEFVDGH
jgi:hypothetical protein